jgi:hypothetical protein
LAAASGAVTVNDIAAGFRKSKNLEKNVGEVLASLARLGHVATKDGKSFEIRRESSRYFAFATFLLARSFAFDGAARPRALIFL